jgi:hypothetical protein
MFVWTIRHLAEIENDQPWLWLEPDAPPVKARWDVLLADDYRAAGKPYYGFVRPTAWRDAEGNLTPVEGDNMMLGVGIYPPDMHKDKELLPLLNDLSLPRPSHPPVPWDIYLRWHQFRRGVHSSTLIYDRWRTCNYTRGEFDEILCEPIAGERGAVGGAIPDEAVLVHGCKDGSLHRLVIGVEGVVHSPFVHVATESPEKLEDWTVTISGQEGVGKTVAKAISNKLVENAQRVLEALNKMDQPRLGAVADMSKVDKDSIKKLLPTLGYEILNAGWIRKLPTK